MGRKNHTAKEIIGELRKVDVLVSQGRKFTEAIRSIEMIILKEAASGNF